MEQLWRVPDLDHVLVMRGTTTEYDATQGAEVIIGLIGADGLRATRSGKRHVIRSGQLGVWHPGEPHAGRPIERDPWEFRILAVEVPQFLDAVRGPDHEPSAMFPEPVQPDPRLAAEFARLFAAFEHDTPTLERESRLVAFLGRLALRAEGGSVRTRPDDVAAVRTAMEYLTDNLAETVTLDELALVAGTTKFALIRLFRRLVGVPPHAYQLALRVHRARRLLEQGIPPAEVGSMLGFHDQSHFHRHFRRVWGTTPGRWARSVGLR